jgi:2,4-dienoyl-CoA reductase-like NADH-dependent reductase (Old Yellow Enzyme family)
MSSSLFQPFITSSLMLANRFVMAPMTRQFAPGGVPTMANAAYYRRRVVGGVGLIITEGTFIGDPAAGYHQNVPRFHGAAQRGWKLVVDEVHDAGGKIMPQLWHVGRERRPRPGMEEFYLNADVPSVSADASGPGEVWPYRTMTEADIETSIAAFADAAGVAQALGFDGVEIHGAHGYLIDLFMRAATTHRTDAYGKDRMRLAVEIVRAIRDRTGRDFPISFRFSQWTVRDYEARLFETPAELEMMLVRLVEAGVDIFHASTRRYWEPAFVGSDRTLAAWTKAITGKTVIAVGSVGLDKPFVGTSRDTIEIHGEMADLERRFADGEFDLVAIGRALLANADWPRRALAKPSETFAPFTAEVRAQLS